MYQDVQELYNFYYNTRLGVLAQKILSEKILDFWPNTKGLTVVGYGFPLPVMSSLLKDAKRGLVLMPNEQGIMAWPAANRNISLLCEETQWPLSTGFIDRLVILHGLETCENPRDLLLEVYRVLGPGGRALFIVPNRLGLWARRDSTPFALGSPYSLGQLERQASACGLLPKTHKAALFFPPSDKKFWQKLSPSWEATASKLSRHFAGGVLMLEVYKQIPAPTRPGLGAIVRKPLVILEGLTKPGGKSAATPRKT
jgi:SAM-dependent methyltransferase